MVSRSSVPPTARSGPLALRVAAAAAALAATLAPHPARAADSSTVREPGRHLAYSLEIEPHLAFTPLEVGSTRGAGLGLRVGIPIADKAFVPDINDSVALSVGLDWMGYSGCRHDIYGDCSSVSSVWLPVLGQWNFWLSEHWSVFGELGPVLSYTRAGSNCYDARGAAQDCPTKMGVDVGLGGGGRYLFRDRMSLTMRVGWPYASFGVSFF